MDSITQTGCKLVLNEVYEGEINGFIERDDAYFALMPDPASERELSGDLHLSDTGSREEADDDNAK